MTNDECYSFVDRQAGMGSGSEQIGPREAASWLAPRTSETVTLETQDWGTGLEQRGEEVRKSCIGTLLNCLQVEICRITATNMPTDRDEGPVRRSS